MTTPAALGMLYVPYRKTHLHHGGPDNRMHITKQTFQNRLETVKHFDLIIKE